MSALTVTAFEQFLARLDGDPIAAAEKYEILRQKIVKNLAWKGCADTEADALADTTLDRVAGKIAQGEQIENLNAYTAQVLRFVWLEHLRKRKEIITDDGEMPETAVAPDIEILKDSPDTRLSCLRKCMAEVVSNDADRQLIVGYYDAGAGEKNKDTRRNLAEKLGLTMTTLKVKACRIRERLEKCINECVAQFAVTETRLADTIQREGATKR